MYVYVSDVSVRSLGLSGFLMPDTVPWVGKFGVTDVFSGLFKISLSQEPYIDAIISKYNFSDLKPVLIPMDSSIQLLCTLSAKSIANTTHMKNIPYQAAVGLLMYLAVSTCSDIVFTVSTVAQFCQDPGPEHWKVVKHIYRYLLGTKKLALTFGEGKQGLKGFTDADGVSQHQQNSTCPVQSVQPTTENYSKVPSNTELYRKHKK